MKALQFFSALKTYVWNNINIDAVNNFNASSQQQAQYYATLSLVQAGTELVSLICVGRFSENSR
jgi:hypothetical protein